MGNRQSGHKYSFQDRFDLLENGPPKSGHYKLQSRQNRQLYIGRQLTCNDQNQSYELQCIINEKLNNPSPFVNKLINSQTGYQQTYCSSDHKFYLLYREVPKLLFDQINQRSANARPFLVQQIESVINRVAKGLKYLYDINHHHGLVSTRSISWPMRPKQSIQLIDEWALANNNIKQQKNRVFRPKDQEDMDQKMLQKSNDLYSLGIVARQMINMSNSQNSLLNHQGFNQLNNKIQVLLSPQPMDRLMVYNMLNSFIVQNQIMESKPLQRVNTSKIMQASYQNRVNTTTYEQMPPNYTLPNHSPLQYEVFNKVNQHQFKNNRPTTNINNNFIYPHSQLPTINKMPINNSFGYSYATNANTLPIQSAPSVPPKNLSLSVSKNNLHTSTSVNHDNFSRNASVGKINLSIPPPSLNHVSSSAKFTTQVAPTASLKNSYIQKNQVNIIPNPTIITNTSNILSNTITKNPEQSNIIQQTKPTIQFSQSSKQSLRSSLINTEPQAPQQSVSIIQNKSVVNFNPPLKTSYIQPTSHISSVNTSIIPIPTYQVNEPMKVSHSSLSNNMEINQVNASLNNFNNVNPSYSNTGGLSYSFGHSDNTFSFKGLVGSSNQENLFTAPDFLTKIRQSNPSMRQSHSLTNIQSLKPQINTLTSYNIPLNSSQNPSRADHSSVIIDEYQKNHNSMDIDKYLSIRESEPISKASSQKQKQLEQRAKQKKQWQSDMPIGSWMSQYPYKSTSSSRQKDKNDYFSTSYNIPTKTSGRKRYVDETSAQFYQKIAITSNNYNSYTPAASTFNYSKYTDYSKYDTILGTLPSLPSYKNSDIQIKDEKINKYEQTYDYKQDIGRDYQPNSKLNLQEHENKVNIHQIIQNQQNMTKKPENKANTISPALQKPIQFSPSQNLQKMFSKEETVQKMNIKLDPVTRDRAITSQIQSYESQQQYIHPESIKNSNSNISQQYTIKNNTIDNFNHIDQNQSYSVSPTSNKSSVNQIEQSNVQVHETQDRPQQMKLIIKENNNQANMYKQIFQDYSQNSNISQQKNKSHSESPLPEQQLEPEQIYTKNIDNARTTPGKHTNSNQPFSTIPQVSQRSMSMKSDQERDYVIEQYQNGSRYQGYKSNGMRNGKGKFYYQQGSFYDGEWKNNNMHGYGKLYYSNNKLAYEGEWFIDQFHGRGRVFNDQPSVVNGFFDYTNFENLDQKWKYYEGDLVCDSKEGEGKLVLSNDQYYEGQFRNDKVQGKGRFVTKNGQIINGVWEDSKLYMKL